MSQIKKYKNGGGTTSSSVKTPSIGKLIKDGKEYEYQGDFKEQFDAYGNSLPEERQRNYFANIRDALAKGETVTYDSQRNELSPNVQFNELNTRQTKRLEKRRSNVGMLFDALTGNKVQNTAETISSLRDFNYSPTQQTPVALPNINFTNRSIEYLDKDGKKVYSNRPANEAILSDIKNLENYLKLGAEGDKNYTLSGINVDAVKDWYNRNPNGLQEIITRAQSGTLNDQDWSVLKDLRITNSQDPVQGNSTVNQVTTEQQNIRKQLGLDDRFKDYNFSTQNGRTYVNNLNLGDNYNGAIFTKSSPFAGTKFENYFMWNGALYSPEELLDTTNKSPELESARLALNPFRAAMENYDYNAANKTGIYFWGNDAFQDYNPENQYLKGLHQNFFQNLKNLKPGQNFKITNLTGQFNAPEGTNIYAYLDPSNKRDALYNLPTQVNYIAYDPVTKKGQYYNTESNLPYAKRSTLDIKKSEPFEMSNWEEYNGQKYALHNTLKDTSGNTQYGIYIDRNNKLNLKIGEEIYPIKNYDLYKKILGGEAPANRANIDNLRYAQGKNTPNTSNLGQGYTTDDKGILYKNGVMQINPVTHEPMREGVYKKGGKFQFGGSLDLAQKTGTKESTKEIKGLADITKSASVKNIFEEGQLTEADKWQLGAIAGDLGALITSIPTGGNPLAAGIGAGSTVAQFVSDVKRDGLDWGDVGRGLGSLGLDAITLLPGAGIGAKAAKTVKILKRSSKLLGGVFAGYGLVAAGQSLANLTEKDKDWSIDDLRNVMTGLQSVIGLKRMTTDKFLATKAKSKGITNNTEASNLTTRKKTFIDDKLKNSSDLADKFVKENGEVDYKAAEKELISKTDLAKLSAGAGKDVAKRGLAKIKSKFTPAERELRPMSYDAQGFWPKVYQTMQNRAIARQSVYKPQKYGDTFKIGERVGVFTGEPKNIYGTPYNYTRDPKGFMFYRSPNTTYAGLPEATGEIFYRPQYKEGGKIEKLQQGGLSQPWWLNNNTSVTPPFLQQVPEQQVLPTTVPVKTKRIVRKPGYTESIVDKTQLNIPNITSSLSGISDNRGTMNRVALDVTTGLPISSMLDNAFKNTVPTETSNSLYGRHKNITLPQIDKNNLLGLVGLINATRQNNRAYAAIDKGIQARGMAGLSAPQEVYNSFQNYGLPYAYEQKAVAEDNYQPVTSDSKLANALELQSKSQANQTRLEGRLKLGELFSNYQDQQSNLRRNYAGIRTDVANKNKQLGADVAMMRGQNEAAKITQNYTNFNNWLMEQRYKLSEKEGQQKALENMLTQQKGSIQAKQAYDKAISPWLKQYEVYKAANPNTAYPTVEAWLSAEQPDQYEAFQKSIYNAQLENNIPMLNKMYGTNFFPKNYTLYKKGGRINKNFTAGEQIWVDQNRDSAQAIKMLNQNIIRIFMKIYK